MKLHQKILCPQCSGEDFSAKYESTYIYSYKIDYFSEDNEKVVEESKLPFMFDNREQKDSKQYIECRKCGGKYPCKFTLDSEKVDFTVVQKAIRGDYADKPGFFG